MADTSNRDYGTNIYTIKSGKSRPPESECMSSSLPWSEGSTEDRPFLLSSSQTAGSPEPSRPRCCLPASLTRYLGRLIRTSFTISRVAQSFSNRRRYGAFSLAYERGYQVNRLQRLTGQGTGSSERHAYLNVTLEEPSMLRLTDRLCDIKPSSIHCHPDGRLEKSVTNWTEQIWNVCLLEFGYREAHRHRLW